MNNLEAPDIRALERDCKPPLNRLDDILALWRECRRLDHRLRILRLRYDHDALSVDPIENDALADEIHNFNVICLALAADLLGGDA